MATIGVLTGGGECPGLNGVICGIVVRGALLGHKVIGFKRGWRGLVEGTQPITLEHDDVEDIQLSAGSILGVSRIDPFSEPDGKKRVLESLKRHQCDMLIVVGGDETLKTAAQFAKARVKLVGIPKTLDNNLSMTDYTFGFVTACNIATEAIERLRTSAKSRDQVIVVEVLGRNTGWISLFSGLGGGAQMALVPEVPFDLKEIYEMIKTRKKAGKDYSIIVVAEGARPAGVRLRRDFEKTMSELQAVTDHSGVSTWLAMQIRKKMRIETQSVVLGGVQRGGTPTSFDRVLGMRLGAKAVDLAHEGQFGVMAAMHGTKIVSVPLSKAVKTNKTIPPDFYKRMQMFFG